MMHDAPANGGNNGSGYSAPTGGAAGSPRYLGRQGYPGSWRNGGHQGRR